MPDDYATWDLPPEPQFPPAITPADGEVLPLAAYECWACQEPEPVPCDYCDGSGEIRDEHDQPHPCSECDGDGAVEPDSRRA